MFQTRTGRGGSEMVERGGRGDDGEGAMLFFL